MERRRDLAVILVLPFSAFPCGAEESRKRLRPIAKPGRGTRDGQFIELQPWR